MTTDEPTPRADDRGVPYVRLTRTVQSGIGLGIGIAIAQLLVIAPVVAIIVFVFGGL